MQLERTGMVLKGIGGFYYVQDADGLHPCRARGKFRKERISPYAGDRVRFTVDENDEGYLTEILPRRNFLVRPPLANLDKLFVVSSVSDPQPSTLIIDKTIAAAELKGIEPVLVFTKTDLDDASALRDIYGGIGLHTYFVSAAEPDGIETLRPELAGCVSAFTGNSGVGKSTLLNSLMPQLVLETGSSAAGAIRRATWSSTRSRAAMWPIRPDFPQWTSSGMSCSARRSCRTVSGNLNRTSANAGLPPARTPAKKGARCSRPSRRARSPGRGSKATSPCTTKSRI